MSNNFEACPFCGKQIMKGAMRCMNCGKILKTAAEQQASIDKYKQSQQSSFFSTFIKLLTFIVIAIAIVIIYNKFGDKILAFIKPFLGK